MKSQSTPSHVSLGVLKVCNELEGLDLLTSLRGGLWMYSHSGDVCCISQFTVREYLTAFKGGR